ncbi:MAG: hypothetical protein RR351_02650, partial [Christensenella sp.]
IQPYSIKIGNKYYSYAWAEPAGSILSVAADIAKGISQKDGKAVQEGLLGALQGVVNMVSTGGNLIFEKGVLQGVVDVFKADDKIEALLAEAAELPSQLIPTIVKQFADMTDPISRRTYSTDFGENALNKIKARIPSLNKTLEPVVDTFGREVERNGGDNSVWNVFFNPSNVTQGRGGAPQDEIGRLYEQTGEKAVFPSVAPYSLQYGTEKHTFSSAERTEYQKTMGGNTDKVFASIIKNENYDNLTDMEKALLAKQVNEYSTMLAKIEYFKQKGIPYAPTDKWMMKVKDMQDDGGDVGAYLIARQEMKSDEAAAVSVKKEILLNSGMSQTDIMKAYAISFEDKDTSEAKSIANAVKNGVAASTFVNFKAQPFWSDDAIDKTNGSKTVQGKEWILENAAQGEMEALYKIAFEDKDTDERDTIKYAQEQGVTPTAFLAREVQKSGEHAEAGESKEDLIWENGKIVVDEKGSGVSGSKMRVACKNLSEGEYSDTEKAYFYQREYPNDNNFALAMEAGIPANTYIGIKAQDFKGVKADSGKTVSGSIKREYVDYINGLDVSDEQKSLLISFEYKDSGRGGRGRGGRRRSGSKASTKVAAAVATSPTIPASAWNIVSSTMKKGK